MKKAILISIRPEWVAKILNGEKTIEIRKTAPKCELPIEVYIYCTKGNRDLSMDTHHCCIGFDLRGDTLLNGKVVAKFTMKNCVHLDHDFNEYDLGTQEVILKSSCLKREEIENYGGGKGIFYWEISDLEVFDDPKELSEFDYPNPSGTRNIGQRSLNGLPSKKHPPQSWCYVEVEEGK